jgi:hypothetical protein
MQLERERRQLALAEEREVRGLHDQLLALLDEWRTGGRQARTDTGRGSGAGDRGRVPRGTIPAAIRPNYPVYLSLGRFEIELLVRDGRIESRTDRDRGLRDEFLTRRVTVVRDLA